MELDFQDATVFGSQSKVQGRAKSSTRLRYEAETQVLIQKNGDLEQVRKHLGLSKKAICQLLLVDPSAWTRWTSPGGQAPPHIFKALDWYLSLLKQDPKSHYLFEHFNGWLDQEKALDARVDRLEQLREQGPRLSDKIKQILIPILLASGSSILIFLLLR